MAEKPQFLSFLSERARFARFEPRPLAAPVRFDLTSSQPQSAAISGLHPVVLPSAALGRYDPDPCGSRTARDALSTHLEPRAKLRPEQLFLTASTSEAYAYLLLALCNPGDAVLVPAPGYPLLDDIAQLLGVRLVRYFMRYDGSWHIDLSTLPDRTQLEQQKIRALVVISPHNPTGHVLSRDEWTALHSLDRPIIVDEVFQSYVLEPHPEDVDPLQAGAHASLTLVLGGLSKSAAAPGLKLGWIIGSGGLAEAFLCELQMVSDAFLSVNQLVQDALGQILRGTDQTQRAILARVIEARRVLMQDCAHTSLTLLKVRAGWSAILRLPHVISEEKWCRMFEEAGVRIQPGSLYDLPFPSSIVVSLLTEPDTLRAGLAEIRRVVDSTLGD